ncbi:MAG: GDP-mannose 4,6-dehydratase [Weeksellaceae bacterium]|nr:GDP-mannose 4,6-dehydratase [Weeksellaceae bacterium]
MSKTRILSKNILLTGGAGFIGSSLLQQLLQQDCQIIVLDNFDDFYSYKTKLQNLYSALGQKRQFAYTQHKDQDIKCAIQELNHDKCSIIFGDIRDPQLTKQIFRDYGIDLVIHLAALAGVRPSIAEPQRYYDVNVAGTLQLLENCKEFKVSKFICASSSSVYGNNRKTPFSESDPVDFPISPYASTKKAAEVLSHVYYKLYNINQLHLRFFTVYGPKQRPDLAIHKFTHLISQGEPITQFGDGNSGRDYTYIADILHGLLSAIHYLENTETCYEIINLGESRVITLKQMITATEKALQRTANIQFLPMQPGDVDLTFADISKAQKLLNYRPQWHFEDGLAKFVEWYKLQNSDSE